MFSKQACYINFDTFEGTNQLFLRWRPNQTVADREGDLIGQKRMDENEPCNIADNAGGDSEKQDIPHPQPHLGELSEVVLSYSEYILEPPVPFTSVNNKNQYFYFYKSMFFNRSIHTSTWVKIVWTFATSVEKQSLNCVRLNLMLNLFCEDVMSDFVFLFFFTRQNR